MEPLRPIVDQRVRELFRQGYDSVTPEAKRRILELLAEDVLFENDHGPLMVSLHRYTASLVRCYRGETPKLSMPSVS